MAYDNQWTLTLSNVIPSSSNDTGVFIGNGKLGMLTSFSPNSNVISQCLITSAVSKNTHNTIETYNDFGITFPGYTSSNVSQSLNMFTGICTTTIDYGDFTCSSDVFAPQHLPFCTVHTVRIIPNVNAEANIVMHQNVACPPSFKNPQYNNNIIYDDVNQRGVCVLNGEESGPNGTTFACAYVSSSLVTSLGFNVLSDDLSQAFRVIQIDRVPTTITFVSAHMTINDFDNPIEETKRIVLSVLSSDVQTIRSNHVKAWAKIWNNCVTIVPKTGIPSNASAKITQYNRHLRYSLYSLFSSVRPGVSIDVNSTNFGMLDLEGSLLFTGDLFVIPTLILLVPEYARSLLDYRAKTIPVARQLAAGYGFKGTKFPYTNDVLGYKNQLYWNTFSQMTLFNTALISINCWNFYRATKDKGWLSSVGYPLMSNIADFFVSFVTYDSESYTFSVNNTIGVSGTLSSSDNIFTNDTIKLALRFAIEASYELMLGTSDEWQEYYAGIQLPVFDRCNCPDGTGEVYKFDATYTNQSLSLAEPLFPFIPYYSSPNNNWFQNVSVTGITQNVAMKATLDTYLPLVKNWNNPINNFILALMYGLYSQTNPDTLTQFVSSFDNFISENVSGAWGHMGKGLSNYAMYVSLVIQGLAQQKIYGGVAETRFYYEEFRVASVTSANMPDTWKAVKIGSQLTQNVVYYTT